MVTMAMWVQPSQMRYYNLITTMSETSGIELCEFERSMLNYVRLSDLKRLLLTISVQEFLNWQGTRKPGVFLELVNLLSCEGLDSEEDLRNWLFLEENKEKFFAIRFIGEKTADYLKILVGLPNVAIDRHLLNFIELANLGKLTYGLAHQLLHQATQLMNINPSHLDHSIWLYMAGGNAKIEGGTKLPKLLTEPRPISTKARSCDERCERWRHKPP